ncbi:MAG TPA: hypothetical protein VLD18_13140, partial [Verrucomicrobiae bacterium]|nr:hypothetical protein [Verrucomicrobiae bacterium]
MDTLIYLIARSLVKFLQALPLRWVARLGRWGGALAYHLDARHRRVTIGNLNLAFGREKTPGEVREIARETFRRLGENYASAVKTASMTQEALDRHLEIVGAESMREFIQNEFSLVAAVGHFGNFEVYARAHRLFPGYSFATTYRALRQPKLDKILADLRSGSGCMMFERRRDKEALLHAMRHQRLAIGFLSDQHAGKSGVKVPFFGHDCSTTMA